MRESTFIEQNREKWARYEESLRNGKPDPDLLRQLYVHTTDDLSYSRTFYPNRSVRVYLNGLAQRSFLQIYRGRRGESRRFFTFWTRDLPLVVHRRRRYLLVSLLIFALAMAIGVVSYRIDEAFAEVIMGDAYMNMTRENIAGGDPMAVYKQTSPLRMSLRITLNNLTVALLTFVAGAFFCVGTVVQLIRNGVMLGVFQYFFFDQSPRADLPELPARVGYVTDFVSRVIGAGGGALDDVLYALVATFSRGGVFRESLLTVWIHGALEISSIVIAGGAGLVLGSGLLFPGTLPRWRAFVDSARDGLRIMLGTVPLFVVAGFLEGYVTRQTEVPDALRLLFILGCFAFIGWYYVVYPRRVAARNPDAPAAEPAHRAPVEPAPELNAIRSPGAILLLTFTVLRRNAGRLLAGLLLITTVFCLYAFLFAGVPPAARYYFSGDILGDLRNFHVLVGAWGQGRGLSYFLLSGLGFYALLRLSYDLLRRSVGIPARPSPRAELYLAGAGLAVALCFAYSPVLSLLLLFLVFPYLMTAAYAGYSSWRDFRALFGFVYSNLALTYVNFFILTLLAIPLIWLLDTTVGSLLFAFLDWVVYADTSTLADVNVVLQAFCYYLLFGAVFCCWAVSFALNFHTMLEIERAVGLRDRLRAVGRRRTIRGVEQE